MRERIGPYRIEKVIGKGGMGLVYKGRHDTLNRWAAIKTLLPRNAFDEVSRHRFLYEARALALLSHANIVGVYEVFPEDDELFIAMEYVDGETLTSLLQRRPGSRLTSAEALPLILQVLAALDHVHRERIIHRDIKPANVLVCNGVVKLTDFGIALIPDVPRLTAQQARIGTPEYMSPEQLEGQDVDCRSDVYSTGLVLYTMLAGHPPFPSRDVLGAIRERMAGPPDLRRGVPGCPEGVWEALCIALKVDPQHRFRSAAELRDALTDITAGFLHPIRDPEEEVPTEVMEVETAIPETNEAPAAAPRRTVVSWLVIAGSLASAAYVFVNQHQRFPTSAPAVTRAKVVPLLPNVELTMPPVTTTAPDPQRPPVTTTPQPVLPADLVQEEPDAEEKRKQEIERLRHDIQFAIDKAEAALRDGVLDHAAAELESATRKALTYPADFWQEQEAINRLRTQTMEARVGAETRKQQDAMWEQRIADIEEDLRQGRWPEAQRFAENILGDARAPAAILERARQIRQQAKDGLLEEFKKTQLGPTNNTIRKPSTPPRKKP